MSKTDFYGYQRPVGKIEDVPALRDAYIAVFDLKSKRDAARFGLKYGRHILDITGFSPDAEILLAFEAIRRWIDGKTNYHEARNIDIYKYARKESDPIKAQYYKTMAQLACIPHVKFHALWATDFAITLINRLYPDDIAEVEKERRFQIMLLDS
ncbi:MAG: hypothetical protein LBH24_03155 [Clostridiales bacterium]|jgi:hypothetical protein|nr:hypothetical protein [Clostridiales bacterium]